MVLGGYISALCLINSCRSTKNDRLKTSLCHWFSQRSYRKNSNAFLENSKCFIHPSKDNYIINEPPFQITSISKSNLDSRYHIELVRASEKALKFHLNKLIKCTFGDLNFHCLGKNLTPLYQLKLLEHVKIQLDLTWYQSKKSWVWIHAITHNLLVTVHMLGLVVKICDWFTCEELC